MNSSSKLFVRGFMILGGVVLLFLGIVVKGFLPIWFALPFWVIGGLLILVAGYWLYKDL